MDKKKLRLIPKEPTPQFIKDFANVLPRGGPFIIKAFMHEEYLILDMYSVYKFHQGGDMHTFRMFHTEEEYITIEYLDDGKTAWRTSALQNLENVIPYSRAYWPVLADSESSMALDVFLKDFPEPEPPSWDTEDYTASAALLLKLVHYQNRIQAARLEIKHRKITDRIDAVMALMPEKPADFTEWVDEEALHESRYLIYTSKPGKGPWEAYCTHCGNDVQVDFVKKNFTGICPNCGSNANMLARGHSKTIQDTTRASLMQRIEGGVVLRSFAIHKDYRTSDHTQPMSGLRNPILSIFEEMRIVYWNDGTFKIYEYATFKNTCARWCDYNSFRFMGDQMLYTRNLDQDLKGSVFQYSAIKRYAEHKPHFEFNTKDYLFTYLTAPNLEYVVKLGLYRLTRDLIKGNDRDIDLKGEGPSAIRNLPRHIRDRAIAIDAGLVDLKILKLADRYGLKVDDKDIAWINRNAGNRIQNFFDVAKETTIYQIRKYMEIQTAEEVKRRTDLIEFLDYTNMAKKLGWDLSNPFVLFPKDLKQAHDRAMKMYRNIQTKEEDKAIKEAHKRLSKAYGYEDKDYIVRVPTGARELTREGHELHHCVGSYIERVASGRTVIVFLRKKQDPYKPYITMEINPDTLNIVQARGSHNSAPKDEDAAVIERYKEKVLKKTTKKIAV